MQNPVFGEIHSRPYACLIFNFILARPFLRLSLNLVLRILRSSLSDLKYTSGDSALTEVLIHPFQFFSDRLQLLLMIQNLLLEARDPGARMVERS